MDSAPSPPPGSDDVLEDSAAGAGGTLPANWWDAKPRTAGGGGSGGLGGIGGSAGSLSDAGAGFVGLGGAGGGAGGNERFTDCSAVLVGVKAAMVTADCDVAPSSFATSAAAVVDGAAYWQVRHRGESTQQSRGRASESITFFGCGPAFTEHRPTSGHQSERDQSSVKLISELRNIQ